MYPGSPNSHSCLSLSNTSFLFDMIIPGSARSWEGEEEGEEEEKGGGGERGMVKIREGKEEEENGAGRDRGGAERWEKG